MKEILSERHRGRIEEIEARGLGAHAGLVAHMSLTFDEHIAGLVETGGLSALREAGFTATADAVKAWVTRAVEAEMEGAQL